METRKYYRVTLSIIIGLLLTVAAYSQSGTPVIEKKKNPVKEETVNTVLQPKKREPKPMAIYGGLVLYKVQLKSRTSLSPYAEENTPDYNDKKEDLTGLMIFHQNKDKQDGAMPDGVYVWDGEQWLNISLPVNNETK
ncbi:hypothetical protein [Dysgonomonas termitidis]|uniref:Uncharacterized protein n=1 Tax=Dysgonomonas termitidis TaxID=1516126 RepID=A0ABV9KVW2_9BACT